MFSFILILLIFFAATAVQADQTYRVFICKGPDGIVGTADDTYRDVKSGDYNNFLERILPGLEAQCPENRGRARQSSQQQPQQQSSQQSSVTTCTTVGDTPIWADLTDDGDAQGDIDLRKVNDPIILVRENTNSVIGGIGTTHIVRVGGREYYVYAPRLSCN